MALASGEERGKVALAEPRKGPHAPSVPRGPEADAATHVTTCSERPELRAASALAVALSVAGCGHHNSPDAAAHRDTPEILDRDGDGLCDGTELARGLDPESADTDGDGFSDLTELQINADPLMIDSPDRDTLVVLPTERLATTSVAFTYTVRGEGGSYVGGFSARPRPLADETSANDFFLSAVAVAATPPEHAALIEGERFVGVVGRTLLSYQVDFEYRDDALIECMRAYPFSYQVKLEDGNIVGYQQRILLVAPRGMEPGNGPWCGVGACF